MAFPIEIIATNSFLIPYIQQAINPLNKVQKEFIYSIASERLLETTYLFDREVYNLSEVYPWMQEYRDKAGGYRPYIILVVNNQLSTPGLPYLFGSQKGSEGLAVFTTKSFDPSLEQFLFDIVRFCRYYIARYTLSFINHEVTSHEDTRDCMFDMKLHKPDILKSLSSGQVCSECYEKLSKKFNIEIKSAVTSILKVVSNQMPRALIIKGGGVKGLAFAGALVELQKYFTFDTFAGTSAGAITAILLGAGYSPSDLQQILKETDFGKFLDDDEKERDKNLKEHGGIHSGTFFLQWLKALIKKKVDLEGNIEMQHLPFRTIVYASRPGDTIRFDSEGDNRNAHAAYAARCSMAIPGFFTPGAMDGLPVFDGGLGNNFPLRKFIDDNNNKLFLGLYLTSEISDKAGLLQNIIDIVVDSDERSVVNKHIHDIVRINPYPVSTTDFTLNDERKEFLIKCGRVAALQYLITHHKDLHIDEKEFRKLAEDLEIIRDKLQKEEQVPKLSMVKSFWMQKALKYAQRKFPVFFNK